MSAFRGPVCPAGEVDPYSFRELAPVLSNCCVRIESVGDDRSSGVLISARGHILTVAHGLADGQTKAFVVLNSGMRAPATVIHRDAEADVALLRLIEGIPAGDQAAKPVSLKDTYLHVSDSLKNRVVIGLGRPARESAASSAVLRIGVVDAVNSSHLRSSCALTAGDSGGPLFDTDGRLLGIHQKIGLGRDFNLHLPLARCLERLRPHLHTQRINLPAGRVVDSGSLSADALTASSAVMETLKDRTVFVMDAEGGGQICCGTRISTSLVVTKLSELQARNSHILNTSGGATHSAVVQWEDRRHDLAVLRMTAGAGLEDIPPLVTSEQRQLYVGTVVYSQRGDGRGIVARLDHKEGRARSSLGCAVAMSGRRIRVEQVDPETAAADAELHSGDILLHLGEQQVNDFASVSAALAKYQAGDWIRVGYLRGAEKVERFGQLRHGAGSLLNRAEYLDGRSGALSLRRTGFSDVIQHDCPVGANQMGGPLVNRQGQICGVNIARRGRESVLALPISVVHSVLSEAGTAEDE